MYVLYHQQSNLIVEYYKVRRRGKERQGKHTAAIENYSVTYSRTPVQASQCTKLHIIRGCDHFIILSYIVLYLMHQAAGTLKCRPSFAVLGRLSDLCN